MGVYGRELVHVWRWIHAAVKRNVKQIELTFYPKESTGDIEIPNCLVICPSLELLRLSLGHCGLRLPNILGFLALRVLDLTSVDLLEDDNLVKGFLESCPLLEDLTLDDCVLCKLDLLCISCLKLKKLSIVNTYDDNDDDGGLCGGVKICCPKLVDLELTCYIAYNYFFECLDSLKKAEIEPKSEGNNISVLFPGISGVEYLRIDPYFFIKCIYAAIDPGLPNLKTLVLSTTMDAFTMDNFNRVLKYYPKLESLKLSIKQLFSYQIDFHGSDGTEYGWLDEDETREILSIDLKRIEFFEFNGEKPKVVIKWFDDILNMYFSWGKETSGMELLRYVVLVSMFLIDKRKKKRAITAGGVRGKKRRTRQKSA
ncbi:unnamed protein product [Lactuca virosa]|uniref:F-box/LRR-repeat protein 15/At3g58940/PEG3-like LRR domain-containing protein n=1 Tax=Lactuca virosa TaxID=75947 RepID=A0AAU9MQC2_9ASTR|nr:unnamed protein product [Lactuca virosa]